MGTSTIVINKRNALLAAAAIAGLVTGLLLGWAAFSHPALAASTVPADALEVAREAGSAILLGIVPEELPTELFTETFLSRYMIEYNAFLRPMATSKVTWIGTPVVTWAGNRYIDLCLIADTQAGVVAVELRLVRWGNVWKVAQLLSLQLREPK